VASENESEAPPQKFPYSAKGKQTAAFFPLNLFAKK
jgi:hypothetical protein